MFDSIVDEESIKKQICDKIMEYNFIDNLNEQEILNQIISTDEFQIFEKFQSPVDDSNYCTKTSAVLEIVKKKHFL